MWEARSARRPAQQKAAGRSGFLAVPQCQKPTPHEIRSAWLPVKQALISYKRSFIVNRNPIVLSFLNISALMAFLVFLLPGISQEKPPLTEAEKAITQKMRGLRQVPDTERGAATVELALRIRQLPSNETKVKLAAALANLSTEGDFGHNTLIEVATTLAGALRDQPSRQEAPYAVLAQLVRYEEVEVKVDSPMFAAAMRKLEAADKARERADFSLTDLDGKSYSLSGLRGKFVLVNFWATWCPPCRKEMPDLELIYQKFKSHGLVILAISDEESGKVKTFIEEKKFTFPVLLDSGRKVNELFQVEGIPKSFVYDREGRLAAQAIDMRTQQQFLKMLALAGLK
jgi:peroxiredoxin